MKLKLKIIIPLTLLLTVIAAVVIKANSYPKTKKIEASDVLSAPEIQTNYTDSSGIVGLSNSAYEFELDAETSHFTVTDKKTGIKYTSVPAETANLTPEMKSELLITYYDSNSSKATMSSFENSVVIDSFKVKRNESSIRVDYSIRKSKSHIFVPNNIPSERFEEICIALGDGPARRLKRFYTFSEEGYYYANESVQEHTYQEITDYMDTAGYTADEYQKDMELLGKEIETDNMQSPGFNIPVVYELSDRGFSARILSNEITSETDTYKLTSVSLLPYFSAVKDEDGFLLVPDGSGAIIKTRDKKGISFSKKIYGDDLTIEADISSNIVQDAGLPYICLAGEKQGFMAYATGAAAMATANAKTYGNENIFTNAYMGFTLTPFDLSDISALSNKAAFNIYSEKYITGCPEVMYFLYDGDVTYPEMACDLQSYLVSSNVLNNTHIDTEMPIYIDYTCFETHDDSFLGIQTTEKTILSSINEITSSVSELSERGISNLRVRLRAYGHNGVYNTFNNGFELEKKVGTEEEILILADILEKNGGRLYFDNNISIVYETGESFNKQEHGVHNLKKMIMKAYDFNLVGRDSEHPAIKYYLTNPSVYTSLVENFIFTIDESFDDISRFGYSWSSLGSILYSDFDKENLFDRTISEKAGTDAFEIAKNTFAGLITDGANGYILKTGTDILNMPLSSSKLSIESYSVPFYQMVISGYVSYAGASINAGTNSELIILQMAESGACPYYSFYTSEEEPLDETAAGTLVYPTHYKAWKDDVISISEKYKKELNDTYGVKITDHKRTGDITVTTYENGLRVFVNYGYSNATYDGMNIPARDFTVIR